MHKKNKYLYINIIYTNNYLKYIDKNYLKYIGLSCRRLVSVREFENDIVLVNNRKNNDDLIIMSKDRHDEFVNMLAKSHSNTRIKFGERILERIIIFLHI